MKNVLGLLSLLVFVAQPLRAQTVPSVGHSLEAELSKRVLWDEPGNGELWVAGLTYKASFTAAKSTFVPVLGASAPKNTPVEFALASVTVAGEPVALGAAAHPERAGDRVVFDHGGVREVWDARPKELEQTFELDLARVDGDVIVRLDVATELERVRDEQGLAFVGEHGSVRYSNAVAWDEHRAPIAIESRFVDGGIELVVPAAFARAARGTLVIDPVITSYAVLGSGATHDLNPDVAYDAALAWQGVVVERQISATDQDCYLLLLDSAGANQGSIVIDTTTHDWLAPKIAYNQTARAFCVVSAVESTFIVSTLVSIMARVFYDSNGNLSPQLFVADLNTPGIGGQLFGPPDVGGDPSTTATAGFCVAFDVELSATNHDVYGALISQGAGVGAPFPIANGAGDDRFPSVSKTNGLRNGVAQAWTVAWQREVTVSNHDIWAAKLSSSGSIVVPEFPVDTSSANTFAPCVSSPTDDSPRRNLVTYTRNVFLGSPDIHGSLIEDSTVVDTANLTGLAGGSVAEVQSASSVDCDGRDFFVAWTETTPGGGATDTYMAAFVDLADELTASGSVSPLGTFADSEDQVEVCAARTSTGAPMRRAYAVWHWLQSGIDHDVYGAAYGVTPFTTYCNPGFDAAVACPCGNGPSANGRGCNNSSNTGGAFLSGLGDPDADTAFLWAIALKPNNACIVLQGNTVAPAGVPFGDGVRCIDGQLLRMAVRAADASGMLIYPQATDPSLKTRSAALGVTILPGDRTGYQVYYRDAQNFACATTFNVTNAVQVQW
ncbi:MAG: hypothetical protein IPJ77_06145 [Planctomycetes bacterium]|nr:hypothetical protein [Planctomycetota bacterium]